MPEGRGLLHQALEADVEYQRLQSDRRALDETISQLRQYTIDGNPNELIYHIQNQLQTQYILFQSLADRVDQWIRSKYSHASEKESKPQPSQQRDDFGDIYNWEMFKNEAWKEDVEYAQERWNAVLANLANSSQRISQLVSRVSGLQCRVGKFPQESAFLGVSKQSWNIILVQW